MIDTIGLDIYSHHFSSGFQNATPGIYAAFETFPETSVVVGLYKNSEGGNSAQIGAAYRLSKHARVYVGLVTGYKAGLTIIATPQLILPLSLKNNVVFSFIPKVDKYGSSVVHLSLETKF